MILKGNQGSHHLVTAPKLYVQDSFWNNTDTLTPIFSFCTPECNVPRPDHISSAEPLSTISSLSTVSFAFRRLSRRRHRTALCRHHQEGCRRRSSSCNRRDPLGKQFCHIAPPWERTVASCTPSRVPHRCRNSDCSTQARACRWPSRIACRREG
jgi:hypothetical protein